MLGHHPFHAVGDKYVRAVVEAAGCVPVLVPALGELVSVDEDLNVLARTPIYNRNLSLVMCRPVQ